MHSMASHQPSSSANNSNSAAKLGCEMSASERNSCLKRIKAAGSALGRLFNAIVVPVLVSVAL